MYCSCLIWQDRFCWKYYKRTIKLHDQCHLSTWRRQVHSISPHWILWTKDKEWWQPSGASRPSDKGGPPVIQTFGPHFGLKIRGGGAGILPWIRHCNIVPSQAFFFRKLEERSHIRPPIFYGKNHGDEVGDDGCIKYYFFVPISRARIQLIHWKTKKSRLFKNWFYLARNDLIGLDRKRTTIHRASCLLIDINIQYWLIDWLIRSFLRLLFIRGFPFLNRLFISKKFKRDTHNW